MEFGNAGRLSENGKPGLAEFVRKLADE